jgi:hypothetical protein
MDPTTISPNSNDESAYYASQILNGVGYSPVKIPFHRSCPIHRQENIDENLRKNNWFWDDVPDPDE